MLAVIRKKCLDEVAAIALARNGEIQAQRDAAMIALKECVGLLTRIGGYLEWKDQETLRRARALIAEAEG